MAIRIAIDAMGGDHAPNVVIDGAVHAVRQAIGQFEVVLVGPESVLSPLLKAYNDIAYLPIHVVHAPEVIGMHESPMVAVKGKPASSIHVGLSIHKKGEVAAFASAGNTGAVMAASLFILGRLSGVARPSIVGYYPTTQSSCIVLDVGANVDCRPEHLVQFARMGTIYAQRVLKRDQPVVALMNVGEESTKGNELVKSTYDLLKATPDINFRGNIEGRDLMHHAADVVICDGFVGNIMLKLGESITTALTEMVAKEMNVQGLSQAEQSLISDILKTTIKPFNYEERGGAPLLGVGGNVLIGHGGSSSRAITQMILGAVEVARQDVAGSIATAMKQ